MVKEIEKTKLDLNVPDVLIDGPNLKIGVLDKAAFESLGLKIRTVREFSKFWVGDWGLAVKEQHGESAIRELAELVGWSEGTVRNTMSLAKAYEASRRREVLQDYPQLTDQHFMEGMGAALPVNAVKLAGEKGWNTKELREYIKTQKPTPKLPAAVEFSWIRDMRVIEGEQAFTIISTAIEAMCDAIEDTGVAVLLLEKWSTRLHNLTMRAQRGGEALEWQNK